MSITGSAVKGVGDILTYWADNGVFDYVLPFLLIFAVVYGILSKTGILVKDTDKSKGVNSVVAIAVALLALQWGYVPQFFSTIFPFAAIGLSILLVALILMGLFADPGKKEWANTFYIIGAVIALVVVIQSLSDFSWAGGNWWSQYGPALITVAIIGTLIALVVGKRDDAPSK